MADKQKYMYHGPLTGVTLDTGEELMLYPGTEVSLPPDNEWVRGLLDRQLLTLINDSFPAKTKAVVDQSAKEVANAC